MAEAIDPEEIPTGERGGEVGGGNEIDEAGGTAETNVDLLEVDPRNKKSKGYKAAMERFDIMEGEPRKEGETTEEYDERIYRLQREKGTIFEDDLDDVHTKAHNTSAFVSGMGDLGEVKPSNLMKEMFNGNLVGAATDADRSSWTLESEWKKAELRILVTKENILEKVYGRRFRGSMGPEHRKLIKSVALALGKDGTVNGLIFAETPVGRPGKSSRNTYKSAIVGYSGKNPRESSSVPPAYSNLMKKVAIEYTSSLTSAAASRVPDNPLRSEEDSGEESGEDLSPEAIQKAAKAFAEISAKLDDLENAPAPDTAPLGTAEDEENEVGSDDDTMSTSSQPSLFQSAEDLVTASVVDEIGEGMLRDQEREVERSIGEVRAYQTEGEMLRDQGMESRDIDDVRTYQDVLTDTELREFLGVVAKPWQQVEGQTMEQKLEIMDSEIDYWDRKAEAEPETNVRRIATMRAASTSALKMKDFIRTKNRLKPISAEGWDTLERNVENSDALRLERFKRWVKKNSAALGLGIGAVSLAATVGGLIVTVLRSSRNAISAGASALYNFAEKVARVFRKAGPVLSTLGSILSTALIWGANGILWLSNNMLILAVGVAAAIYARGGK